MQIKSYFQTMKDGAEIKVNKWLPDEEVPVKGVLVLHHGLAEHSMRYDRFGSVLSENGYILIAHDVRGHGATAEKAVNTKTGRFGQLSLKDGFNKAVEDLYEIVITAKAEYPGVKIISMGHSFGSFVTPRFIEKYSHQVDGCILCGTSYMPQYVTHAGHALACIVRAFRGKNNCSKFLKTVAFGSYDKRIEDKFSPNAWISVSKLNVEMYDMDQWCGIPLTNSFFCDLLYGLNQIGKNKNIAGIRNDLPVFFIYGSEDPVGNYGKSIKILYSKYEQKGMNKLSIKEYTGDRHEILNEDDKETVEADILNFLGNLTK